MDLSDDEANLDLVEEIEREKDLEEVSENEEQPDEAQTTDLEKQQDDEKKAVPAKKTNPRVLPKLNAETLKGEKGLKVLPGLFKKQNFKGKGFEEHDLDVLLKTYKYWCHRLFPKYTFRQCIEKLESVGSKKPVMTYVKKIRMGLLEDEVEIERPQNDEEALVEQAKIEMAQGEPQVDKFDSLKSTQEKSQVQMNQLTAEQEELIRQNKERALKIRQERLKKIQDQASSLIKSKDFLINDSTDNSQVSNETQDFGSTFQFENTLQKPPLVQENTDLTRTTNEEYPSDIEMNENLHEAEIPVVTNVVN